LEEPPEVQAARQSASGLLKLCSHFCASGATDVLTAEDECERQLVLRRERVRAVQREVKSLADLFAECGELQKRSGYTSAGDFSSEGLNDRAESVLAKLEGVRLLQEPMEDGELGTTERGLTALAHGALGAMSVQMRTNYLCQPASLLPRIQKLRKYLEKVRSMLRSKLAIDQAMNDT